MKKLLILITIFGLVGCSHFTFEPSSVAIGIQLSALNAGSEFAYKYPEMVKDAEKLCSGILESKGEVGYLFELAKQEAAKVVSKNPTQAASLEILFNSVTVEGVVDLKKFKMAAEYFQKGMDIRK